LIFCFTKSSSDSAPASDSSSSIFGVYFIPALAHIEGAKVGELKVDHRERRFGKSKYGISRTIRVILDLITVKFLSSYSTKPLQIFGLLGFITGGIGVLIGLYLAI